MFGSKKSVLGIDIGSKTTKIALLSFVKGKAKLEKCAIAETGFADEAFIGNLRSFLAEQKVKGLSAAACFDDPSMVIRKMELPQMPEQDFQEALRWSLRDHVEADPSEYVVTYSHLKENPSDQEGTIQQIVAYAVKRQAVQEFKSKLEQVGLSPHMIEPEPVSLASTLDRCEQPYENFIAGVDIGHSHTLFYVIGNGVFVFSRPIKGIDIVDYEKEPQEFSQRLAIEVQKSIDTFQVNFEMQNISALYLSGGGALIDGLDQYLETNMGMVTKFLNPFKTVSGTEAFEGLRSELFAKAIGLAYTQI